MLQRAEQGDVEAQIELSILYSVGAGVPEDQAESVAWVRRAAEQGNASGEYLLGRSYERGRGVIVANNAEAAAWYRRAAQQGHVEAQNDLGNLYYFGNGVIQDYAEAFT